MPNRLMDARWFRFCASLVLALLFLGASALFIYQAFSGFAWDFSINWTAAWALRKGLPLYDQAGLQALAVAHIDSGMLTLFNGPFQSYISLPTTAMFMLPFTLLPYEQAEWAYRFCSLLALTAGLTMTVLSMPPSLRRTAAVCAALLVVIWHPAQTSIKLGQLDGWVVLALGMVFFGVSRERWALAGCGIGIASLLKISPVLLLVYCLLKRQWAIAIGAISVLLAGALLCLLPQQGNDISQFFSQVIPPLRDSTMHIQNQSLGAALARLASETTQWAFSAKPGGWQLISLLVSTLLTGALFLRHSTGKLCSNEIACLVLIALLAGSISWDHYFTWAILPTLLLVTQTRYSWILVIPFLSNPAAIASQYTLASLALVTWLLFLQRRQGIL